MPDFRLSELIKPTERQLEAFKASDSYDYLLFGGAGSGGKSYFLRWWCLRQLIRRYSKTGITGLRVGLFSQDYPTLTDRQISRISREFPDWLGRLRESRADGYNFALRPEYGGGMLALRNLDDPSKYKSSEFCDIAVEELTEIPTKETFDDLRFRLRWPGITDPKFVAATNPTGVGHAWVKALWIDRKFPPEMQAIKHKFCYVPALPKDNPHVDESYAREKLASLPDKKRRALLEGDWSNPEGQYFTNFERSERVIHPSVFGQLVKPWWPRWISQDWGFKHHSPVHWHTVGDVMPDEAQRLLGRGWSSPRKCVFTYREHVVSLSEEGQSEQQWAEKVVALNQGETLKRYFLSADAFGQKSSANTPADVIAKVMRASSLPQPEKANMAPGSRVAGWRFLYQLIANDSWFISEMCPLALDAIPALEYDSDKGGEDILKTDHIFDDVGDELRYGLVDMLNSKEKPWTVTLQEAVQRALDESGPTRAHMVHLQMEAKHKPKAKFGRQYL